MRSLLVLLVGAFFVAIFFFFTQSHDSGILPIRIRKTQPHWTEREARMIAILGLIGVAGFAWCVWHLLQWIDRLGISQ